MVGGILTAAGLILVLVPVLYEIVHHRSANSGGGEKGDARAATTFLSVGDRLDGADVGNGSDPVG